MAASTRTPTTTGPAPSWLKAKTTQEHARAIPDHRPRRAAAGTVTPHLLTRFWNSTVPPAEMPITTAQIHSGACVWWEIHRGMPGSIIRQLSASTPLSAVMTRNGRSRSTRVRRLILRSVSDVTCGSRNASSSAQKTCYAP
jgi:hypothetical protein